MSPICYCFAVARALREVFWEMDHDVAKGVYRDAFYATRQVEGGPPWRIFRSDVWMKDTVVVGFVIAGVFLFLRFAFRWPVGLEIALAFVYAFIAYVPNAAGFLEEEGPFDISFLMTLYYSVFLFGVLYGAYWIPQGLALIICALVLVILVLGIIAGIMEKLDRKARWQKEAEQEARAAQRHKSGF